MVLRLKNKKWDLLYCLGITFLLCLPLLCKDFVNIEHDTFFHLSRIEQLSRSISEGNFFPAIYPYENNSFGYGSPLFYCDVLLIPFALIHLAGLPLSVTYQIMCIFFSFLASVNMFNFAYTVTKKKSAAWLACAAYLLANYHITDLYVRSAIGEITAMAFLPLVLNQYYCIVILKEKKGIAFAFSLALVLLSHNLTFLMCVILILVLSLVFLSEFTKETFMELAKGTGIAFLLTVFFSLPMIEQLQAQKMILNYYGQSSDLAQGSMNLWQFFVNETIFGYSGNNLSKAQTMTVNTGWFVTFLSPLWFAVCRKEKNRFISVLCIIGLVCMVLPASFFPWNYMTALRILQFPWRLNTIALVCLCIPASAFVSYFSDQKKWITASMIILLCAEGFYHVHPVFSRTFGMDHTMVWSDITDGKLCDPYYSANYVRVELAGGDYLPMPIPDFHTYSPKIKDEKEQDLSLEYEKKGTQLTFAAEEENTKTFILPLTWYKGYTAFYNGKTIPVSRSAYGMVTCENKGPGTYVIQYKSTPLRKGCLFVSFVTLMCVIFCAGKSWLHKQ